MAGGGPLTEKKSARGHLAVHFWDQKRNIVPKGYVTLKNGTLGGSPGAAMVDFIGKFQKHTPFHSLICTIF